MRHIFLITIIALILGAGCFAIAKQQDQKLQDQHSTFPKPISTSPVGHEKAEALTAEFARALTIVKQGQAEVANGRYTQGEILFHEALTIQPQNAKALLMLADVYEKEGKQTEALNTYHAAIYPKGWSSSITSDPFYHMRYVLALTRTGHWEEAVSVYNKAMQSTIAKYGHPTLDVTFDPQIIERSRLDAAAHLILGTSSAHDGPPDPTEQRKHMEEAVRLQPRWAPAQYAYGKSLEKQGRRKEALSAYHKAASLGEGEVQTKAQTAYQALSQQPQADSHSENKSQ